MKGKRVSFTSRQATTIFKACKKEGIAIKSFCRMGVCGICFYSSSTSSTILPRQ